MRPCCARSEASRRRSCWRSSSAGCCCIPSWRGRVGRALFSLFGIVVLGARGAGGARQPGLTWVSVMLGIPAAVLLVIQAVTDDAALQPYSAALEAVLYFYAAYALIRYMLADHKITRDELYRGRGDVHARGLGRSRTCSWSGRRSSPAASSRRSTRRRSGPGWSCCSCRFTTLSSTGLSDVVPIEAFARRSGDDRAGRGLGLHRDRRLAPGHAHDRDVGQARNLLEHHQRCGAKGSIGSGASLSPVLESVVSGGTAVPSTTARPDGSSREGASGSTACDDEDVANPRPRA